MNILAFKLLESNSFTLRLNAILPNFAVIKELLSVNGIPFETWNPGCDHPMNIIEMSFTTDCNFLDIYLLAYIFKDFGVESIFPSRKSSPSKKNNTQILVGTYLHQVKELERFAIAEPMSIESFLAISPRLATQFVVGNCFKNHYSYQANRDEEVEKDNEFENYYEEEHRSYDGNDAWEDVSQ